jgi:hypothetical protein
MDTALNALFIGCDPSDPMEILENDELARIKRKVEDSDDEKKDQDRFLKPESSSVWVRTKLFPHVVLTSLPDPLTQGTLNERALKLFGIMISGDVVVWCEDACRKMIKAYVQRSNEYIALDDDARANVEVVKLDNEDHTEEELTQEVPSSAPDVSATQPLLEPSGGDLDPAQE